MLIHAGRFCLTAAMALLLIPLFVSSVSADEQTTADAPDRTPRMIIRTQEMGMERKNFLPCCRLMLAPRSSISLFLRVFSAS